MNLLQAQPLGVSATWSRFQAITRTLSRAQLKDSCSILIRSMQTVQKINLLIFISTLLFQI